ncbi:hypothetical protein B0H16DRAFT_1744432 [Mycena metata]|uniref:Protein kinase domain-containing protein n=1 Tax=Mycena metata TaxID=1033252 RepID=A0AAD7H5A6_9AGAR|nr:hypothetical protein B0H16DRAFT_1744432 [Mycena metata]
MSTANGVSIAHGQLSSFFLATRVVVKIARGVAATQRLDREFLAYSTLRTWQGVAIPRMFGMYTSTDEKTKVLLMSDAGKTLRDFSDLKPVEKRLVFTSLVRLHQSGVLHNDVEPRNVTRSETSGPFVIDFDEASFHHVCMGPSCKELLRLAQVLQLDAGAEIAALAPVARARSAYLTFAALIFAVLSVHYLLASVI